ncbi:hypothetical protein T4B_9626 [Trichinella pseudospiralis]|uniref:Uncharacterized protein n=1 Tax=Trichinella pseudospiralis TaxID=6337 RepID=A0A0V1GR40_TRIPS|nr:hypothetical protein T4A_7258 [Trichinella pseudospiralis]KRZ00750.1 hypothetical protein T4B_9626 [Trichinella pseudospiralis]KRZ22328.1 hypothetical protein T4C_2765 [Trichinella pseudospiralis]
MLAQFQWNMVLNFSQLRIGLYPNSIYMWDSLTEKEKFVRNERNVPSDGDFLVASCYAARSSFCGENLKIVELNDSGRPVVLSIIRKSQRAQKLLVGVVLAAVCAFSGRSQCYVDLCCRLDMHGSSLLDCGGQLLIDQSIEMEEFGRNFVYKQVGHIITAEEYKCQVQPSHRTDKSISKSTWAPEPQTCRRSSNGIWCSISVTVRSELDCNAKAFTLGWTCIRGEIYAKMVK